MAAKNKATDERPKPGPVEQVLRDAVWSNEGSLQSLAEAAGVPRSALTRFRAEERTLKLPTVDKLLTHLGARIVLPKAAKKSPTQARKGATRR